jgi:hypothetical protein
VVCVIDDEADNASINTASDATSPTSINARLRELLSLFDRNTYVGYTATPFANRVLVDAGGCGIVEGGAHTVGDFPGDDLRSSQADN